MVAGTIMPTVIPVWSIAKKENLFSTKQLHHETAQLWNTLLLLYLNYEAAGQHGYEEALGLGGSVAQPCFG